MSIAHEHFTAHGTRRELDASAPLTVSDPDKAWFVAEGRLDVFLVSDTGEMGRDHCFSTTADQVLYGLDPVDGHALLAVGVPGTVIFEIGRDVLAQAPEEVRVRLVDGHLDNLARGLVGAIESTPQASVPLLPDADAPMERLAVARPVEDTVWARHKNGDSLYLGMEEVDDGSGWFPVAPATWLQAMADSELEVRSTARQIRDTNFRSDLDCYHRTAMRCLILTTALASADRLAALREKTASDVRVTRDGLLKLASIMDDSLEPGVSQDGISGLEAACAMVGRALGMDFSGAPLSGRTIEEVAESGTMRARRVLLRGDWFREDGGPMVAFLETDKRPVTLLPSSARSYRLHDPRDGSVRDVTRAVAEELEPGAYSLYRPLPSRKLTLKDVPLFGLRGSWRDLGWVAGLGGLLGLMGLVTPMLTRTIFNDIIPGAERGRLLQVVAILLGFTVASLLFEVAKSIAMLRAKARTDHNLETALWERLMRLPANFFREYTAGDLAQRSMALNSVQQMLSGATLSSMFSAIFSMVYLGLLFHYDTKLALLALLIILVSAVATGLVSAIQIRYQRKAVNLAGKISGQTLQFISGIAKLRAGGAEDRALSLWAGDFAEQRRVGYRMSAVGNAFSAFNTAFSTLGSALIFIGVIYFEREDPMDMGTFMAFWAAFGGLQGGILSLVGAVTTVFQAVPYFERLKPILEATPEGTDESGDPGEIKGNIELSGVSFRYADDGPMVLKDVSLTVEPGQFVAITGPSGSGKTTLLRLLLGFENPQAGAILFENQDLSQLDAARVRRQMGVVLQNGGLMPGDIFTNIIGASTLTVDDAWRAAEMAGFAQDIKEMPMGMHTVISEGASTLSGGQRQRLIIARALARNPKILLFDEATSALDNRTQEIVTQSLNSLPVTRIVIAHRLSTIKDADAIIVLEDGQVREQGTYDELMEQKGLFHNLAKRQMA